MRLSDYGVMALMSSLVLLMAGVNQALAATNTATVTVTLKATFTAPPCTLTQPDQVFLGSILQGKQSYTPFSVEIACPTPTNTALYAEVVSGTLTAGSTTRVNMTAPVNTGTPAQLWLTSPDGNPVTLDGSGNTTPASRFCSGDASRSCVLTPYTQVAADTPRGETTATLRLSVAYP
ncbi:fimbrial protein [Yokenella regensburgei]|uniref:fimbrial protein n=1 Tax=Yokenella regensburgei TaxID=158877 RepID=UPI0027D9B25A|nr:fimbrial protein [Yokenella regensburgei]MDQ4429067.1 fimbrial protein [Yokenella regensburgei]